MYIQCGSKSLAIEWIFDPARVQVAIFFFSEFPEPRKQSVILRYKARSAVQENDCRLLRTYVVGSSYRFSSKKAPISSLTSSLVCKIAWEIIRQSSQKYIEWQGIIRLHVELWILQIWRCIMGGVRFKQVHVFRFTTFFLLLQLASMRKACAPEYTGNIGWVDDDVHLLAGVAVYLLERQGCNSWAASSNVLLTTGIHFFL